MDALISAQGLCKRFGRLEAVRDVSLTVRKGEVLGFLGPNGSGKSTTMKMLSGFLTPDAGTAAICGLDAARDPAGARRFFGYLPEGAPTYEEMTPASYLKFISGIRGISGADGRRAVDYAVERTNIAGVLHQTIETLSKGYKRRVGLAQAILHNPRVLILDEPTDGLDPNQKHDVRAFIRSIAEEKAIILSTHILEEVEAVCHRTVIIAGGRIVAEGATKDLAAGHGGAPAAVPPPRESVSPAQRTERPPGGLEAAFRRLTADRTDAPRAEPSAAAAAPDPALAVQLTRLQGAWIICKRELLAYFTTPIAYVFAAVFLTAAGAMTFFAGDFFTLGQAGLESFFQFHPWLYLLFIPALGMRLWAEEHKTGSIELLLTLPVPASSAVLGKFAAAWTVAGLALALTCTFWLTVNYLGAPDNAAIAAGYAGSFLVTGGFLAVGAFVSALTKNQITAFILTAALCFVFTASGLGVVLNFFSGWVPRGLLNFIANFSFLEHFRGAARGVIDMRGVVFFASTIAFFLFANTAAVEARKNI